MKTYIHTYIYNIREISIEHPSVGLTSLAQLIRIVVMGRILYADLLPDCEQGSPSEGTEPLRLPRDDPAEGGGIPITIQDDQTFIFPLVFKLLDNTK